MHRILSPSQPLHRTILTQLSANRGIPYRRGYLFHGPPGTGKTSLTFALAGVFGLDIHVVSLLEPTLTEEELGMLFTTLPARCIVLLEDIDTAGLVRGEREEVEGERRGRRGGGDSGKVNGDVVTRNGKEGNGAERGNDDEGLNVASLTKALKRANEQSEEDKRKGISLSGLLNIIDGVASHEGRVLVMTTNRPEKLDEALIRPGRVDHQVRFGYASRMQIGKLFERMYSLDLPVGKVVALAEDGSAKKGGKATGNGTAKLSIGSEKAEILTPPITPTLEKHTNGAALATEVSDAELSALAKAFAEKIPDDLFSPAEIQGFLLKRKKHPRKAAEEVGEWVRGMEEGKRGF